MPGEGRWGTALLLDGNIGIGGDAMRLLARLHELLATNGRVLAELSAPDVGSAVHQMRVETEASVSPWFPWAVVSASDIGAVARSSGYAVYESWSAAGRWFAELHAR